MAASSSSRVPHLALAALLLLLSAHTCRAQTPPPTCDPATSRLCEDECQALDKPCFPDFVTCSGATQPCNGECIPDSQTCVPQGLCAEGRDFCVLNGKCLLKSDDCVKLPNVNVPSICPDGQVYCITRGMQCRPISECNILPWGSAARSISPKAMAAVAGAVVSCALVALAL